MKGVPKGDFSLTKAPKRSLRRWIPATGPPIGVPQEGFHKDTAQVHLPSRPGKGFPPKRSSTGDQHGVSPKAGGRQGETASGVPQGGCT